VVHRNRALLLAAVGVVPVWAVCLNFSDVWGARCAFIGAVVWLAAARRSGWPEVPWGVFFRAWLEWALVLGLLGGVAGRLLAGWAVWDAVGLALGAGVMLAFFAAARRAVLAGGAAGGLAG